MNIAIFGLRRGGNHPIINWICRQLPGITVYYNDCKAGDDPHEKSKYFSVYHNGSPAELIHFYQNSENSEKSTPPKADNIVHTYEDFNLSKLKRRGYHERYKNTQLTEILILRDPYNWSASRILSKRKPRFKLWLIYAEEFIGDTNFLHFDKIPINYNEWFSNRSYRDSWLKTFGIENHDRGIEEVSIFGGGSSFDRISFDGKAQEMNVLERWKKIELEKNPDFMMRLKNNPQVREYAKRIFQMDFPS